MASYKRGVQETKTRLAKEMAGMCRNYYAETWAEVLNWVGVLSDSELRSAENIFFLEDIREVPTTLPPPVANPLCLLEQLPTIQVPSPDAKILTGAKKGKEVQPQTKAKHSGDDLTIRDMGSEAKDVESKSKAVNPKEDPHQANT